MQNHLKDQTSPYLLQHVNNPVDWFPWCEEAFEKAKAEDKPIFLSIGYSTCPGATLWLMKALKMCRLRKS